MTLFHFRVVRTPPEGFCYIGKFGELSYITKKTSANQNKQRFQLEKPLIFYIHVKYIRNPPYWATFSKYKDAGFHLPPAGHQIPDNYFQPLFVEL